MGKNSTSDLDPVSKARALVRAADCEKKNARCVAHMRKIVKVMTGRSGTDEILDYQPEQTKEAVNFLKKKEEVAAQRKKEAAKKKAEREAAARKKVLADAKAQKSKK